jgi:2-dehydropantoate 2-reductase
VIAGILGSGAIGTLLGATLAPACEVRLLVRDNRTARAIVSRGGLVLDGAAPRRVAASADPGFLAGADIILIALKTFVTIAVLQSAHREIGRIPVVSFQNGADAVPQIEFALRRHTAIALAPSTEAVVRIEPGIARRTGLGRTHLGWAQGHQNVDASGEAALEALAVALASDLEIERAQPIEPYVWAKLVANAAINPLTALSGRTNGELLEHPELRERAARIAREAAEVARRSGIVLPFDDPVAHVEAVMRLTAPNRSSMLVDLERGGPTEIESINGAVVRKAMELGIPVPENARALDEVRARQRA